MLFLGFILASSAQDYPSIGYTFSGHAAAGNGHVPSLMDMVGSLNLTSPSPASVGDVGGEGQATWSVSVEGPEALLTPGVSLSYSSAYSRNGEAGYGFSLHHGASLTRASRRLESTVWAGKGEVFLFQGLGASGVILSDGMNGYVLENPSSPVLAKVERVGDRWRIVSGGSTLWLEPRLAAAHANGCGSFWTTKLQACMQILTSCSAGTRRSCGLEGGCKRQPDAQGPPRAQALPSLAAVVCSFP